LRRAFANSGLIAMSRAIFHRFGSDKVPNQSNLGLVEAAGAEPDSRAENAQVIDSENARIGMFSKIAKSSVRSLYSDFPEFQELPNSTFTRSLFAKRAL
jgi:hypothetical protein